MPKEEKNSQETQLSSEDPVKNNISQGLTAAQAEPTVKTNDFIEGDMQNNVSRALSKIQESKLQKQSATSEQPEDDQPTLNESSQDESSTPTEEDTETVVEVSEEGSESETVTDDSEEVVAEDSTSQEETDDDDAEEEWFYLGEHTQYRTPEDAKEGITQAQLYARQLKSELEAAQSQLSERNAVVEFYSSLLPQEDVKAKVIESYMPEEFRGKSEEDFTDDSDLRKYVKAQIEAETRFQQELETRQDHAKKQAEEQERLAEEARKFVQTKINPEFFGAKNPSEASTVKEKLSETLFEEGEDKLTYADAGRLIHELLGEKASEVFFRGIREDLRGAIGAPDTTKKVNKPTAKRTEKKVEKVAEKVKETKVSQKPIVSTAPPVEPKDDRTSKEKIAVGLAAALGKK